MIPYDTIRRIDKDIHDKQAHSSARQKKPVHCYRLCTKGTVEERILAAAQQKTIMNALVMQDNGGPNQVALSAGACVDICF